MTQQVINVGAAPNDGTGDPARTAFTKTNSNFTDLYAGNGNFLQAGTGAVTRTVQSKERDIVSVKDFGAVGDGVTNDTAAIQAAVNTNKAVYFPTGVYLVGEITIPPSAKGATYYGDGFYHYASGFQTVVKAKTLGQNSIFLLSSGADCITFTNMRMDGDVKADKCIDGTFGSFLTVNHVGVYDGVNYGVFSKQGLARISQCFMAGSRINLHLWSDSAVSDSEFTQTAALRTEICLLIAAGGDRLTNIWANSGTVACVQLKPFDGSTTHINTDIVNLYAGETLAGAVSAPVVDIVGTVGNRVQQVRITGAFIVSAEGTINHINDGVKVTYGQDIELCNINFRGQGAAATAARRMNYGVIATNTENLTVLGGTFRDLNKNPVNIGTGCQNINVIGTTFIDWALDAAAAGNDFAAIISTVGMLNVTGCTFAIATGATGPFAAKVANATDMQFIGAVINYPNANIVTATTGVQAWQYKRAGVEFNYTRNHVLDVCLLENYLTTPTAITAAAAANNSMFLDSATNKLSFKNSAGTTFALY